MAKVYNRISHVSEDKYLGETKFQLRDGFGVYNYPNKFFRYEGEWQMGKKHGHGKLLMKDGSFYEGQFDNGEISGHGYRKWASSGNQYTGQFIMGELNGQGIMEYGNGKRYEGGWANNMRQGEGKLIEAGGSVYEGSFYKNNRHGEGCQTFSNGDQYEGDWVNNTRQGHGVMKYNDGSIYGGQWRANMFNGEGSYIHSSGVSYEGMWINDRPEDESVELRVVGDTVIEVYQGQTLHFEVESINADGERTHESGRVLQVTAGIRVKKDKGRKSIDLNMPNNKISTPFGFEVEPYPITEFVLQDEPLDESGLGEGMYSSSTSFKQGRGSVHSEDMSTNSIEMAKSSTVETTQIAEGEKEKAEAQMPLEGEAAKDNASLNTMEQKSQEADLPDEPVEEDFVPAVSPVRTQDGVAICENVVLPPPARLEDSFSDPLIEGKKTLLRWKKTGTMVNVAANMLKNGGQGKDSDKDVGKKKKDNASEKKKDKKDSEKVPVVEENLCKPGDYVVIIEDATSPPFMDSLLKPAFLHVKVTNKKRVKSTKSTKH